MLLELCRIYTMHVECQASGEVSLFRCHCQAFSGANQFVITQFRMCDILRLHLIAPLLIINPFNSHRSGYSAYVESEPPQTMTP